MTETGSASIHHAKAVLCGEIHELSNPFRGAEFLAISVVGSNVGYTKIAMIAGKSSCEFHRAMVELPEERRILK